MNFLDFYKDKTVLITGHTGFKGTWLTKILTMAGAKVVGVGLDPVTEQNLFELSQLSDKICDLRVDIRNYDALHAVFEEYQPEIVFHLAAQPIVLEGYKDPKYTYEVNVMGTANLLECIRTTECVKTLINVTTDKVYQNMETGQAFKEDDRLNGYDPYANSKSCSELITECYYNSFWKERDITVVTMRAGNVIGGGDYAPFRIIPDCVRAAQVGEPIVLRNPAAVRPFQHVLEPLFAYLYVGSKTFDHIEHFNIGPSPEDHMTTEALAALFCKTWGDNASYTIQENPEAPHEAELLYLDCTKIAELGWRPTWNINETVKRICEFHKAEYIPSIMEKQILDFEEQMKYVEE